MPLMSPCYFLFLPSFYPFVNTQHCIIECSSKNLCEQKGSGWDGHNRWQSNDAGSWSDFLQHTSLPRALSSLHPNPQFLPFQRNPFHVIKDTQMKWPTGVVAFSRKSGSASRISPRAALGWLAEGSATARINIISVINIKSALLCFASGRAPKLWGPGRRSPWPFTKPIIYFGEFLRYCFVRANQGWVTNDPSGVVGNPSVSGTRGQTHFWKFHVNYSCPWLPGLKGGKKKGSNRSAPLL